MRMKMTTWIKGGNWKKEKQNKKMRETGGIRILVQESKGKCEQMRKEESGACMQPHVRDGMVYFGKLTQGRDK